MQSGNVPTGTEHTPLRCRCVAVCVYLFRRVFKSRRINLLVENFVRPGGRRGVALTVLDIPMAEFMAHYEGINFRRLYIVSIYVT